MATKFRQVEGVPVESTQQNLSLQTDGSLGITEAVGAVQETVDTVNVDSFRDDVIGIVDAKETEVLGDKRDASKELNDKEVAQLIGTKADVSGMTPQVKALSKTLATINRAANQNKIDPATLEIRLEAATRQAMRRHPRLAREFAQVQGLYGGSTLVAELDALRRAGSTKSDEQKQLEKFVDEAVDFGMSRGDFIADPGKFLIEAYTRSGVRTAYEDDQRAYALEAAAHKSGKFKAQKGFAAFNRETNGEVQRIHNKYKGVWGSVDVMRQEIQDGSQTYKQMLNEIDVLKAERRQDALDTYGAWIDPADIENMVDVPFTLLDSLVSENTTAEMHSQSQNAFDALSQATFSNLPADKQKFLITMNMLNRGGVTQLLSFGETASLRDLAGRAFDVAMLGGATDYTNEGAIANTNKRVGQAAVSMVESYTQQEPEEKEKSEKVWTANLADPLNNFSNNLYPPEYNAGLLYTGTTQFLKVLDELNGAGVTLPPSRVREAITVFSNPAFVDAMDTLDSDGVRNELEKDNALDGLVNSFVKDIRQPVNKATSKLRLGLGTGVPGRAIVPSLTREDRLGKGVFLQYNVGDDVLTWVDSDNVPLLNFNSPAIRKGTEDLHMVIRSKAHLNSHKDYLSSSLELQDSTALGTFLRVVRN